MLVTIRVPCARQGRQHGAHAPRQQRVVAGRRVGHAVTMAERHRAFADALEHDRVEPPLRDQIQRRIQPIGREPGAGAEAKLLTRGHGGTLARARAGGQPPPPCLDERHRISAQPRVAGDQLETLGDRLHYHHAIERAHLPPWGTCCPAWPSTPRGRGWTIWCIIGIDATRPPAAGGSGALTFRINLRFGWSMRPWKSVSAAGGRARAGAAAAACGADQGWCEALRAGRTMSAERDRVYADRSSRTRGGRCSE